MPGYFLASTPSEMGCHPVYKHIPVLLDEVLTFLRPHPGGIYIDATVGEGGHAEAVLRASAPSGRLIGIDRDAEVLGVAHKRLEVYGPRAQFVHGRAADLRTHLDTLHVAQVDGVLLDLGVSAYQLETPARGFSFTREGPLDMRMDRTSGLTAATLVNTRNEDEIAALIRRYGEERWAYRIARAIVRARRRSPISTTQELAALVTQVIPPSARPPRIHPATRTFQALRIAVNQELDPLEATLAAALTCLRQDGRLCVIAYHSLEDRTVKQTFRAAETSTAPEAIRVRLLTRKPITPSVAERRANPRARSGKLRVLERA